MRWVKLTLPRPEREREPLMTLRLTSSSLAGTLRKLVAVGTSRLASMFLTITAPTPLINSPSWPGAGAGAAAGADSDDGVAVVAGLTAGAGAAAGVAVGAACSAGTGSAGA